MSGAERIFINYRRADTRWAASRLYDGLSQRFGSETLFMDVDSIPPGADFVEYLNSYVDRSNTIIVIIGPNWLNLCDDLGRRRIDDPDDFVNIEIRRALERNVTVIPVLVDGAKMPSENDLPADLKLLSRRQAVRLGHDTYGQDIDRLARAVGMANQPKINTVSTHATPKGRGPGRKLGLAAVALAAAASIGAVLLTRQPSPQPSMPRQLAMEKAIAGMWSSDYGEIVWDVDGARYGTDNGRLVGAFDGLNFQGHWIEDTSENPCAKQHEGSDAWGSISLTFDDTLDFFQGQWGYCDTVPDRPWAGTRSNAAHGRLSSYQENLHGRTDD